MEILAPVGSFETLKIAVYSGADAVYLGLDQFNARMKAENFNISNIKDAVNFAHIYGVKVYITVNTLIKNEEIKSLMECLRELEKAHVDAIIVQDLSIPYLLRDNNINLVLHASTQLGVNNLEGVRFLELLGFKRVVLARETSLSDIVEIKKNTTLEIEYFVHGAVCVSYSGACLFSAMKNANSGNRGLCLQLCRKKYYSSLTKKYGYYLSIKDQCLAGNINVLKKAGIDSLKIEGRMKSPEYLQSAINLYNKVLNNEKYEDELFNVKVAYNRGNFFDGYIFSKKNNLIFSKIQGNYGHKVGHIVGYKRYKDVLYMIVESDVELTVGDGVKIISNNYELGGFTIDKLIYKNNNYLIPIKKEYGTNVDIHLTSSKKLKEKVLITKKQMPVEIILSGEINSKLKAKLTYKEIIIELISDYVLEKSVNGQSYDLIKRHLAKMNDTPFYLKDLKLNFKDEVFIPNAVLGDVRRELLKNLENRILLNYIEKMDNSCLQPISLNLNNGIASKNYFISNNIFDINKVVKFKDAKFIYYIEDFSKIDNVNLQKISRLMPIYVKFPLINTTKENKKIIDFLNRYENIGIFANSVSQLFISYLLNRPIILGDKLNIFNNYFVKANNISEYVNSLESKYEDISQGIVIALKRIELMHFLHCPLLVDTNNTCRNCQYKGEFTYTNYGEDFIIDRNRIDNCQFTLFNNLPGSLLHKEDIYEKNLLFDFTKIDDSIVNDVLDALKNNKLYSSHSINKKIMLGVK